MQRRRFADFGTAAQMRAARGLGLRRTLEITRAKQNEHQTRRAAGLGLH